MVLFLAAACATEPADTARLASVQSIFLDGVAEPHSSLASSAHLGAASKTAIGATLTKEGYRIVPDAPSADAVLSVKFEVADYGPDKPFHQECKPSMLIDVSLKDLRGRTILQHTYFYADAAGVPAVSGWRLLRADPKYTDPHCSNFSPGVITAAFRDAVPVLAQAVGAELSKP
jgi:hypothetical protein